MKLSKQQLQSLITITGTDVSGKNLRGICPKCGHNEFGISLDDNHIFGCYRERKCGFRGNIFTLLKYLGKYEQYVNNEFYSNSLGKLQKKILQDSLKVDLEIEEIHPPLFWKRTYNHEYLNSRGFTQSDYLKYPVGTTNLDPYLKNYYIIFLLYQYGKLVGYLGRHIWSKQQIKEYNEQNGTNILRYRNSDTQFSKILFGFEEITDKTHTVVLVEGIFDKINTEHHLGSEEVVVICTFKCDISDVQVYLLTTKKSVDTIILLYDPDVINKIQVVATRLDKYYNVLVGLHTGPEDPGEMSEKDFIQVLNTLQTPYEFISSRIHKKNLI